MDLTCYNSYYEVNLSVLEENFKKISRFIAPAQVIPVLKADAYGMGALEIARVLTERCGCRTLACSQTYEGLVLREGGITDAEILIMGPVLHDTLPHAVRWDMQIPLFTPERVRSLSREAARQGKTVKAQIKIETGLNRIGAWPGKQLQEVIDALHQCPNIQVVGVFTHFAQAETPEDAFTKEQFAVFKEGVAQLEEAGFHLSYIHCCNTGASEWYREALDFSTHIRAGSLVLGYSDIADGSNPMGLQEMLSWRTTASFIRHVEPGETVSYDRLFKAEKPTDIAVVSVGFADGILCAMARSHGPVLVNDQRAHYVDTCMDQCFVDVTGLDCRVGDPVTLWGYSPSGRAFLSPQELSKYGQVYTAYTSQRPDRIGRIYIG